VIGDEKKEATMCGGVRFKYDEKLEPALSEMYTTEQLDLARTSGTIQSVFWQPRPVLPAIVDGDLPCSTGATVTMRSSYPRPVGYAWKVSMPASGTT